MQQQGSDSINFADFQSGYAQDKPQLIWTAMIADLDTPVSAFIKLAGERPNSFLFESVESGKTIGRYSFLGLDPDLMWRCNGDLVEINRHYSDSPEAFVKEKKAPLESLRSLVAECRFDLPQGLPPMVAGIVGYMGYETVRLMERVPTDKPAPFEGGLPEGLFIRPQITAVFDRIEDKIIISTTVWPTRNLKARDAFDQAYDRLHGALNELQRPLRYRESQLRNARLDLPEATSNITREDFKGMVKKAKEYVLAGDIFQVVLSQRFEIPFQLPALALYRSLRRLNPSPFLFFLNFEGFSVVGSSPEILVRVRDGKITIRPIAGTRKRGKDDQEDKALAKDLLSDPKELAEHLMLLDLGRNDVGRAARIGSVKVTERMIIERYSHVMHIVSNVEGDLDEKRADLIATLCAGFPAGTVSGAPKVRAMEIIEELEPERRGIYGGAIGYFGAGGGMDTCIALRTALIKDERLYIQAGAGIVADSDPESEHQECHNKARAIVRAAQSAIEFANKNQSN